MAATVFPAPVNDLATTLASPRTAGANTLVMAAGSGAKILAALAELGYGAPSASKPLRVAVTKAAYTARGDVSVLQATGLSVDTLTGVTTVEGTPDQGFATGDTVEIDLTAGVLDAVEKAVNAIETATTQATPAAGTFYRDSGGGVPTFGAIAVGDVPALPESKVTNLTTDLAAKATDAAVVHLAGGETITGVKAFSALPTLASLSGILKASSGTISTATGPDLPVFVASGASHAAGAVPDPGAVAGSTKFLCENATWATPAGGGSPGGSSGQLEYNNAGAFGGAVALVYAGSVAHLTITAQALTDVPLILRGAASQSANFIQCRDSGDVLKASITNLGTVNANGVTINSNPGLVFNGTAGAWSFGVFSLPSLTQLFWAQTNNHADTKDVSLGRDAAGVVAVRDGSFSTLKTLRACIRSGSGAPGGTPENGEPYWDSTNFKLYIGAGGAWKSSAAFT